MASPARHVEEAPENARPDPTAHAHALPAPKAPLPSDARPATPIPPPRAKAPAQPAPHQQRWFTPARLFFIAAVILLYLGWYLPTERYISPKRGVGYALGIIGGSLMLLLFLYSARKHIRWLRFLGPTVSWFRFHMVLGILGPLCILYHSNFSLGAANSNVALFSMLTVAGSGLIGRYIYARIHQGLYGSKLTLGELQVGAEGLRAISGTVGFLPELVGRLEDTEKRLLATGPQLPLLGFVRPLFVAAAALRNRWRLRRYIRKCLRAAARSSTAVAAESRRLRQTAYGYVDRRLAAARRVAEFQGYERLFSLWHALHFPLIFMLVVAAVVHVIAVHVY